MKKIIDLEKNVHDLIEEYPELMETMNDLGFSEISKKSMLNSIGKMMTIPKGAKMKDISMEKIENTLKSKGFEIKGDFQEEEKNNVSVSYSDKKTEELTRKDLLKSYLKRIEDKEELERVREDFVENFSHVEASEIMEAEQELIKEGLPLTKVQKLCDLHSALFHGSTREERIAEADKAVIDSLIEKNKNQMINSDNENLTGLERVENLKIIAGHPLNILSKENDHIGKIIDEYKKNPSEELFSEIKKISVHYAKKGDNLYPLLKVNYDISGPNDVMWKVDDEIRDELSRLNKEKIHDEKWQEDLNKVLTRAEEMVYKERNILFPICAENFVKEEWFRIYHDLKDYETIFTKENGVWKEAESHTFEKPNLSEEKIVLPTGSFKLEELIAMLDTMPLEITFVDKEDINRYYNDVEETKVFKRPLMSLGRKVWGCHPAHIEPMVRQIIEDFRAGKRDKVPVWTEKKDKTYLVTYMAVRDKNKKYLGTLELVQEMEHAKEYFQKNK